MASDPADARAQETANVEAAHREAYQYWGYLIKADKCGTPLFDRLLKGIAEVISTTFEPGDCRDITPSQIAAFYRAVGGNYDVLFIDTPVSSISFIYRALGAFHSLQPAPDDDGYSSPTVPALKQKGFVTWQTIQLLLGPEDHVGFLQKAVAQFDVKDPETGQLFPKILPKECLPTQPDEAMEAWYESVADRLRREVESDATEKESMPRRRVNGDEPDFRASNDISDGSADEKHAAAKYFSDPLNRKARVRPPFVRRYSRDRIYEHDHNHVENRNKLISNVRHLLNPFNTRRKSAPGRYEEDDYSDEDATPIATAPHPPRYPSHKRPHPRRETSLSTTDSDSDSDLPPSRRRSPVLRHRRSEEPATSPREYFPPYYEEPSERRYSHDVRSSGSSRKDDGPPPVYGPTKSPLFATHVANAYYDRARPSVPAPRTSYRPQTVRYATVPPEVVEPPYVRERDRDRDYTRDKDRDRDRDYSRDKDRDRDKLYEPVSNSSRHRRRRSDEYPRERERVRERDRSDSARTRSHDRVKDEWDEREAPSRERSRDGSGRGVRYSLSPGVGVVQGASGRRYPVEAPWR